MRFARFCTCISQCFQWFSTFFLDPSIAIFSWSVQSLRGITTNFRTSPVSWIMKKGVASWIKRIPKDVASWIKRYGNKFSGGNEYCLEERLVLFLITWLSFLGKVTGATMAVGKLPVIGAFGKANSVLESCRRQETSCMKCSLGKLPERAALGKGSTPDTLSDFSCFMFWLHSYRREQHLAKKIFRRKVPEYMCHLQHQTFWWKDTGDSSTRERIFPLGKLPLRTWQEYFQDIEAGEASWIAKALAENIVRAKCGKGDDAWRKQFWKHFVSLYANTCTSNNELFDATCFRSSLIRFGLWDTFQQILQAEVKSTDFRLVHRNFVSNAHAFLINIEKIKDKLTEEDFRILACSCVRMCLPRIVNFKEQEFVMGGMCPELTQGLLTIVPREGDDVTSKGSVLGWTLKASALEQCVTVVQDLFDTIKSFVDKCPERIRNTKAVIDKKHELCMRLLMFIVTKSYELPQLPRKEKPLANKKKSETKKWRLRQRTRRRGRESLQNIAFSWRPWNLSSWRCLRTTSPRRRPQPVEPRKAKEKGQANGNARQRFQPQRKPHLLLSPMTSSRKKWLLLSYTGRVQFHSFLYRWQ